MTHIKLTVAAALLLAAACAPMDADSGPAPIREKEAKLLAKELDGKVAGKPVNCIRADGGYDPIRISDDILLYRASGRLVYQNKLKWACRGLARDDDIMVVKTFNGQYCRGDVIHLVDRTSGIQGGSCVFGEFTPYRKDTTVAGE